MKGVRTMARQWTRRQFLWLAGGAVLAAGGGLAYYERRLMQRALATVTGELDASYVRQIVAADNAHARTLMWQAAAEQAGAAVELRRAGETAVQSFPATSVPYADDGVSAYLQTAQLTDLAPGQAYEYRLRYGEDAAAWQPLTAAGDDSFAALVFPDSQSNDYTDWRNLARQAYARFPEAQFFINMGDLVDNGEDHRQWEDWFEAATPLLTAIPVAPIMGNHETYNQQWKVREPLAYLQQFAVPEVAGSSQQRSYYAFDYGPAHFLVLNTQQDEMAPYAPDILAEQQAWFAAEMSRSTARWNIVLMHKDPLQYAFHHREGRAEGFSDDGRAWMPLFDKYGVDLVLSAHLHTYRNRGHIRDFQRDERGPLYVLTGVAGNVRYPDLWQDHTLDLIVAPQPEVDNYLTLKGDTHTLTLASYQPDGAPIDEVTLRKS